MFFTLPRLLLALALSLLAALPAAAQPYPSVLCAGLNDSSGVPGGNSVGDCDLDGNFIQQKLSSTTFGQFNGLASAVSDGFGHVGLLASAQFIDYGPGAYVPAPFGIYFAASARALFTDYLGVLAPYPEVRLVFRFDQSGSLTPPAIAAAQLCHGLAYGAPPRPGDCTIELTPTLELLSEPFVPDGTLRELAFNFEAVVFINDERMPAPYTTSAVADLAHTITMAQLLVTLPDGTPARGVSLSSGFGIDYPLAPENLLPVPEPGTWALWLAGLAVLPWRTCRRRPGVPALARWALFTAIALGAATQAAAADQKLLAAARAAQPAVVESLREMVLIESGSQDAAGVKAMADYVEGRLRALGAATERIEAGIGLGEMVNGTFAGTGKRNFMLIAHLDTVYPKGILATEPYRQDGNKLYGPGIADDKGGIAVILHSLAILRDAGWNLSRE